MVSFYYEAINGFYLYMDLWGSERKFIPWIHNTPLEANTKKVSCFCPTAHWRQHSRCSSNVSIYLFPPDLGNTGTQCVHPVSHSIPSFSIPVCSVTSGGKGCLLGTQSTLWWRGKWLVLQINFIWIKSQDMSSVPSSANHWHQTSFLNVPQARENPFTHTKCSTIRGNRTLYLVTGTCCLHQNSVLKSSCWTGVFLGPGCGSSTFLENAGFHFRGTKADKCREVPSHFKQHQPGALKFNPSWLTLGNSQHATSSNDWPLLAAAPKSSDSPAAQPGQSRHRDDGSQICFPLSAPQLLTFSPKGRGADGVNGTMKKHSHSALEPSAMSVHAETKGKPF